MKIVICPDSFKESISSIEVCNSIEKGIKKVFDKVEVIKIPLADGGEGTIEAISLNTKLSLIKTKVLNPIGIEKKSYYAIDKNNTSIIEMALASGINLIDKEKRNPLKTTTFGVGQLIKKAVENNSKKIIIGLGGSATSDCGAGALQALGFEFFDDKNNLINEPINNNLLGKIKSISNKKVDKKIFEVDIVLACDVKNTLLGSNGAVYTYALQKGAKKEELPILEKNIENFINVAEDFFDKKVKNLEGSGAAGGLGAGLSFLNTIIKSGIEIIFDISDFKEKIKDADFIFTGEGKIDNQTVQGKVISGILKYSNKTPIIALTGSFEGREKIYLNNTISCFSILNQTITLEESIKNTAKLIEEKTEDICRLIKNIRSN